MYSLGNFQKLLRQSPWYRLHPCDLLNVPVEIHPFKPPPTTLPTATTILLSVSMSLFSFHFVCSDFQSLCENKIMWYMQFSVWLISLKTNLLGPFILLQMVRFPLLWPSNSPSHVYVCACMHACMCVCRYYNFFVYSPINIYLGCSHIIVNNAAMNIRVHISF